MDDENALGKRIRMARLDRGLSLSQLASAVGRSSSSVRRWERGESAPSSSVVVELARVLHLDAAELSVMVDSGREAGRAEQRVLADGGTVEALVDGSTAEAGVSEAVDDGLGKGAVHAPVDGASAESHDAAPIEDVALASETPKVIVTLEDEDAAVEVVDYFDQVVPAGDVSVERQPSKYEAWSAAVWNHRDSWIGWVRGVLTALALVFLLMGLIWALGELWDALRASLGSFSTGA